MKRAPSARRRRPGRDLALARIRVPDELRVAGALHVAAEEGAVEHVHGGEERAADAVGAREHNPAPADVLLL
jgi:hypothetical protein